MKKAKIIERLMQILSYGNQVKKSAIPVPYTTISEVDSKLFTKFQSLSLSFIQNIFDNKHLYYKQFSELVAVGQLEDVDKGIGIIEAIVDEVNTGWLSSIKDLISADIFTSVIEQADYLLEEGYKDAAAVMIGATLEQHLIHLSKSNNLSLTRTDKKGKDIFLKASQLNQNLKGIKVVSMMDFKQIQSWLDIRNNAAHGNYDEYTKEEVENMSRGVKLFISKTI